MIRRYGHFRFVFVVAVLLAVIPAVALADSAAAQDYDVMERIDAVQQRIDGYKASGDLQTPLAKQLSNALQQVRHHWQKGHEDQAIKKMQDFLKHLRNEAMDKFVSKTAKNQLERDALLVQLALPPGPGSLTIVRDGQPAAAVVVSEQADSLTKQAAQKLVDYVKKSTGAELPLIAMNYGSPNVQADNGVVRIALDQDDAPAAEDFLVQPYINGTAALSAHPSAVSWDADTKTATLTVPQLTPAAVPQTLYYKIVYKGTTEWNSSTLTIAADAAASMLLNSSFEIGYSGSEDALPWRYIYENAGPGAMTRSDEQARSGNYSLKVKGIGTGYGWPLQRPISFAQYGLHHMTGYAFFPQEEPNGTVQLFINLYDESGTFLHQKRSPVYSAANGHGEWIPLNLDLDVPETINGVTVDHAWVGLEVRHFSGEEAVYIDDVELIRADAGTGSGTEPSAPGGDEPNGSAPAVETQIFVGKEFLAAQGQDHLLDGMASDGFVFHPDGSSLTIAGPSSWGTLFGVNAFLERYLGVLWLMPGEDWEDVPAHDDLFVPAGDPVREEPAFFSRAYEGGSNAYYEEWKRNNRMRGHVQFAHNLFNLFPPAKYKDTHPHFYAEGANLDSPHGWQPCFTAEGIVEEAIKNINAYFDANPQATSYSIGINDTTRFCEADPNHPHYPGKLNSIGMVDMSEIFFNWVNQVAAGVFAKHPDKFLGTYAYFNVYDPPENMQIDPRVVVYITDERLTWAQPDLRDEGRSLTERWLQTGATIAFYEYLYGSPYMVPRSYYDIMAENYRYAADVGVEAYYNELYPNFGEGPKPWLSAKLQWNPYQDVDALLDEWYERAVGPAAKDDLAAYYAIWQKFWEEDIFGTGWYLGWRNSASRTNFLPLYTSGYLSDVSKDDIAASRQLLESVVAKAETPLQKKRAEILLFLFGFYEASVLSYPQYQEAVEPATEEEATAILKEIVQRVEMMEHRYELFDQITQNYPELRIPLAPLSWQPVTNNELLALVQWLQAYPNGATANLIDELAATAESQEVREWMTAILGAAFGTSVRNPGFEDGFDGWFAWPDTVAELTADAHSGNQAMRVRQSSREQTVYLEPGKTYELTFYAKRTGGTELNLVGINFWDVPGIGLTGERVTVDSEEYEQYIVTFTPPPQFSYATIVVYKDPGQGWVYVDDFTLREIDDAGQ